MTMFSKIVEEEHRLFLPLYYESFYAAELLQKRCLTRIKKESLQRKKDLLYMTIEFFNEDGNKVGELKNFANKLVRSANLINSNMEYEQLKQDKLEMEDSENIFSESGNNSEDDVINDIESFLKQLMAEQLEVSADCIDTQAGYYEMGLDSPGLLRIVSSIEEKVDEILPPTLLFEYTTIKELSEYLVERYGSHFIHSNEANDEELNNNSVTAKIEKKPIFQEELKECEEIKGSQIQDIAVIGMSGRYPQAENIQEFWENLFNGRDCITEIPKSRWDYHCLDGLKSNSGKSMSKWGGFIKEPDRFDAKFFRVSPRDAETMDPQERLFLEVCWETIEDSGYTPKNLVIPKGANNRRDVGVFVGVMHKDYTMIESDAVLKGQVLPVSFSHAQIANRVSYFCNFNGPSIAVDTVCSSSLTAVHLAMESINHDECEVAIAGGVNLSLHPNKYMTYGMMDMQSSEGRCRAFGEGGDGYVSADGVAAILLKPLKKAIEDNDHIYAVIKGSAINHVGTVSGITVPSPVAQGEVIDACLKKTGIDPRTISYVEAHGTGTSLGDPIEIEGLVRAYKNYTSDHQYCSIGSVKSNIGHAESAAGVIGLQKVVLQLYYKTLVKSLHSEKLNSYIDFEKSPFYVQRKTEEWKTPTIVTNGKEIPVKRRAGLSSFGASGSNVHLILEEYISDDFHTRDSIEADNQENLVLVPLSAKNKDRLLEYAKKLLDFITVKELSLRQLAYTFQTGREAMEVRVAFLSSSIFELKEKIKAFITGNDLPEDCWFGEIKNKKSKKEKSDKGLTPITAKNLITLKQRLKEMAELWINGESVNWELLYGEGKPRKISLPTYPFANEHYWIPIVDSEAKNILGNKKATEWLHPLLQKNTSDFSEQRFSTTFTGDEIFLLDHMINGQKHLPGVAHLEMVREAVKLSVGADKLIGTEMRIKDVVWIRPVVVEQPVTVNIGLYPGENEEISFEIYQDLEEDGKELIVYSQGYVLLEQQTGEEPSIDIASVEAKCKEMTVSGAQCYEAFKDVGFEYGPSHNGIEELLVGDGQVVGKLSLAPELFGFVNEYMLHPGITDSALQASIGLILRNGNFTSLVPFALDEVRILKSCTNKMRALIKYADSNKEEKQLRKLNIDLYDMQGMLCVSIKGLSTKAIEMNASGLNIDKTHGSMLLKPKWVEKTACLDEVSFKKRIVMLCAPFDSAKKSIKQKINGVRCFTFSDNFEDAATAFTDFSMKVFENIQSILLEKPLDKLLIQIIIPNCGEKQIFCWAFRAFKDCYPGKSKSGWADS
ncbi:beta-ketoacyl synthase N-terminal-like domain-containing protein [Ruminiclostridium josui]|uniref:beta-ketoacyl synthase N-terminal-like domain-containing protein n=1 Tax=Ruminiclostridium josui TaxID=1499 RepID=UPI0006CFF820|nr:beta-ketoacyl synthase N-terminal-like domain-containing protein [Ruminiclostridium josui]